MEEYKPNSHKYREEQKAGNTPEKKVEKVVNGSVKTKKKSEAKKLADIFIAEDVNNVKSYIFMDVLVPAVKKAISDIVTNGIDMVLYGETGRTKRNSAAKVSYGGCYTRENDRKNYSTQRNKAGYYYDDITLDNRGEAEDVLSRMDELVAMYGVVSVADLYDLVGVSGSYTDNKYGWTDIRNASVVRVKDRYMIKLPKALPLN